MDDPLNDSECSNQSAFVCEEWTDSGGRGHGSAGVPLSQAHLY